MNKTLSFLTVAFGLFLAVNTTYADNCGASKNGAEAQKASTVVAANATQKPMDIIETAVAAGSFNTLVAAVQAAGLVETLKGAGPFTVFAPTDEAFAKLPTGTVEALLKDKAKLTAILTYHVVPGEVTAADVVKLSEAKTVNGQSAKVTVGTDGVMIDGAKVVKTDVITTNGVIHVIDSVILPKDEKKS